MSGSNIQGVNRTIKRGFDVVLAFMGAVIACPFVPWVAAAIKLTSRGPVLFTQTRVGEKGRRFRLYKFRTMRLDTSDALHREYTHRLITNGSAHCTDQHGNLYKIDNDPRLTPIGGFLRRFSVDEIPQLLNVLRGDMSLIGPRPPVPYEVEVYQEWHKRRLEGPPGITGLWQVSGRSRLSFEEMVRLDIEYLENWSIARDFRILWRTMGVVLFEKAY